MTTRPNKLRWRAAALAALMAAAPATAEACGNPMLWAMLFKKVPEAKAVYDAELTARADGHLTARVYDARPGETYHQWSKAWLLDLAAEMQPTFQARLEPGATITILLADEVAAMRFAGGEDARLIPAGRLMEIDRYDLVTTINALKAVWRDGLAYRELLALDLATGTGQAGAAPLARILASR